MQDDAFTYYSRHSGSLGGVDSDDPSAPQLVVGSHGNDHLTAARTTTSCSRRPAGHQTLTGGAGDDKFVFNARGIDATITDFSARHDTFVFDRPHGFDETARGGASGLRGMSMHAEHGDTVIEMAGAHIVLADLSPHGLRADDFLLA